MNPLAKHALRALVLTTLTLAMAGCASQKRDIVLDASGGTPGWVTTDQDRVVRDGREYFRGFVDRQKSLDMAVTRARFTAVNKITDSVMMNVRTAFGESTQGVSNDIDNPSSGEQGGAIQREIAAISKAVSLSGVVQEASYWEKVSTKTANGDDAIAYKVYALVSIPEKALKKAQLQATEGALSVANKVRNDQAKASLTDAFNALKQELDQ